MRKKIILSVASAAALAGLITTPISASAAPLHNSEDKAVESHHTKISVASFKTMPKEKTNGKSKDFKALKSSALPYPYVLLIYKGREKWSSISASTRSYYKKQGDLGYYIASVKNIQRRVGVLFLLSDINDKTTVNRTLGDMKLTTYAKELGVSWKTANRWYHKGQIPGAYQLPSGSIIVPNTILEEQEDEDGLTIVYARVSSSDQRKTALEYQADRLVNYSIANGWIVDQVIKEVGSGLNDKRNKLDTLLRSDKKIKRLVIEHKDRLTRFGFNYLEILSEKQGFEIIIVNPTQDDKEDLLQDFISIITSYCARIYGQRRGKRKTETLTQELEENATN